MPHTDKHFHWTTVEVRGDDGLLQLGRVIDCASGGLMIDFRCGTGVQLVPFGQIYHSDLDLHKCRHAIAESQDLPVNVLIRLSSKEPAKWYHGILLMGAFGGFWSFGLVRATTPNGTLVEIVPADRIRERHSEDSIESKSELLCIESKTERLLEKGWFVKAATYLPSGISSGSPSPRPYTTAPVDQHLVDRFNKNSSRERMVATHIDGGVLHVLRASDRSSQSFHRDCPNLYYTEFEGDKLLRMLGVPSDALSANAKRSNDGEDEASALKKMSTEAVPLNRTFCQKASTIHCSGCASILDRSLDFQPINGILPKELLAEIFTYLDGAVQAKLRGICSGWNDILHTVPVVSVFRLPEQKDSIIPGVCLLKRWTAQAKIIVNTGLENRRNRWKEKQSYDSLMCTGNLFWSIKQEHHLPRLEKLMLANISWEWSAPTLAADHFGNFVSHLCEELNLFASVCQSVVLKDVTVAMSGFKDRAWWSDTRGVQLIVHITKGRIEKGIPVGRMWDRMDSSLPLLPDADVDRLKELIANSEDLDYAGQLAEILYNCQSADPRSDNRFCGKEWSRDDLAGLDLTELNRITLHTLLKTFRYEKLVIVLEW